MIYIAASPWFVVLASSLYSSILIALLLIGWPWWVNSVVGLVLGLDYLRVIYLYGLRQHQQSVAAITPDCAKWQYQLLSGKQYKARLVKQQSYCSQFILILCLRSMTGIRYVVIPRDALSKHNYRFLAFKINS